MQRVRDAVAEFLVHRVQACFTAIMALSRVLRVAFDETEVEVDMDEIATHSLMMLHADASWRDTEGHLHRTSIMLPPAVLENTTAENLVSGIRSRVGSLMESAVKRSRSAIVLMSDSAKSCLRVHRHYGKSANEGSCPVVASRCMMHMVFMSLVVAPKNFCCVPPMFCATLLLHKGHNMRSLRKRVRERLAAKLVIVYEEPPDLEQNKKYSDAVMRLLNEADIYFDERDPEDTISRRCQARKELCDLLPGRWSDREAYIHYCSIRCGCKTRTDAVDKVMHALNRAILCCTPPVPALNRWNKLFAPMAWWYAAIDIHGIVLEAFMELDHEDPGVVAIDETLVAGPSSEETYRTRSNSIQPGIVSS